MFEIEANVMMVINCTAIDLLIQASMSSAAIKNAVLKSDHVGLQKHYNWDHTFGQIIDALVA